VAVVVVPIAATGAPRPELAFNEDLRLLWRVKIRFSYPVYPLPLAYAF